MIAQAKKIASSRIGREINTAYEFLSLLLIYIIFSLQIHAYSRQEKERYQSKRGAVIFIFV